MFSVFPQNLREVRSVLLETLETRHSSLVNPYSQDLSTQEDQLSDAISVTPERATPGPGMSALSYRCSGSTGVVLAAHTFLSTTITDNSNLASVKEDFQQKCGI